ncbi:MAG: HAMP domain-containing histidine kinase [Actinobacteria bacterium]|nr:MAG: HAMP domain-containing histidine kinase [Actinomycetota bacterium]
MRKLTSRAVLVTCLVALVSVLVTALVAAPLALRETNRATREGLAQQAELAAALINTRPRPAGEDRIVQQLRTRGFTVFLVADGKLASKGTVPPRLVKAVAAGLTVSNQAALVNGRLMLVEGRPLPDRPGSGILLAKTGAAGLGGGLALLRGLWWALLAGLAAGAVAGVLLAGRLARPIRHAAAAAVRLSAGDRTVRVQPEAPAEVEELAHALNGLTAALATSEGRQRDFLLSVSHELRTPLTTIKGYAEALSDGVIAPEGVPRAGATVLTEAENLERLVGDLLALARLDAVDFPVNILAVDLVDVLSDAARAWIARCPSLRVELPTEPVVVATDPGRIRQVVDGLVDNALRVIPADAPVVLAVRPADPAGFASVEVRDGGPGFSDADLALVFERGAMSERYQGIRKVGSGLGLALAHGLVRRLGGTIEVGHAPEGGARFTVRLPVYQARTSH